MRIEMIRHVFLLNLVKVISEISSIKLIFCADWSEFILVAFSTERAHFRIVDKASFARDSAAVIPAYESFFAVQADRIEVAVAVFMEVLAVASPLAFVVSYYAASGAWGTSSRDVFTL